MATPVQRMQSIANALTNGNATAQQVETLAQSLAGLSHANGDDDAWPGYSNAEKAAVALSALRGEMKRIVRRHRTLTLDKQAAQQVDAEFPETP